MSTPPTFEEILERADRAGLRLHMLYRVSETTWTAQFWRKLAGGGSGFYGSGDGKTITEALINGIAVAQRNVTTGKLQFPVQPMALVKPKPAEPWDDPAQGSDPDEDIFG